MLTQPRAHARHATSDNAAAFVTCGNLVVGHVWQQSGRNFVPELILVSGEHFLYRGELPAPAICRRYNARGKRFMESSMTAAGSVTLPQTCERAA